MRRARRGRDPSAHSYTHLVTRRAREHEGGEDGHGVLGLGRPALNSGSHGQAEDGHGLGQWERLVVLLWVATQQLCAPSSGVWGRTERRRVDQTQGRAPGTPDKGRVATGKWGLGTLRVPAKRQQARGTLRTKGLEGHRGHSPASYTSVLALARPTL